MRDEILSMALFGMNSVELIPRGLDDASHSPHFEIPWLDMLWAVTSIADEYDLMVSTWYPAFFQDYFGSDEAYNTAQAHWNLIFGHMKRYRLIIFVMILWKKWIHIIIFSIEKCHFE